MEIKISPQDELNKALKSLIDKQAITLTKSVKWVEIKGLSNDPSELYPIAIVGKGSPLLMLHGFDSCFMEFRRLVPFLENKFQLIIPDLYGFGFCPRPHKQNYGIKSIINHLDKLMKTLNLTSNIGLIGASMGGGIAMELARSNRSKINQVLLLSPAGVIGKPSPIPPPFNNIGACFLKQLFVREGLCKRAFYNHRDVGPAEKQIASIHINVPGWQRSLAEFAREGGIANCAYPMPEQTLKVIWGKDDRILNKKLKINSIEALKCNHQELEQCGHLPHIDRPSEVAKYWTNN